MSLADLYISITEKIQEGKYKLEGSLALDHMSDEEEQIHLAKDYLFNLFMAEHSILDSSELAPLISIPELENDTTVKIIKDTSVQELTTIVSPEAYRSTKWSILEDLERDELNKESRKIQEIKNRLSNTSLEINHYGAVYTPDSLVNIMLNEFDRVYKENNGASFFADPDVSVCDPASGSGSFLLCSKLRFINNLRGVDEKHIVNEMLFGSEIQKLQALLSKKMLNYKNKEGISPNIHNGDSLLFDFWDQKFDLVIGNPPYQGVMTDGKKRNRHNFWEEFLVKGLDILRDGGYLVFITPPSWMSPSSKYMDSVFRKYRIHHLEVDTISKFFPHINSQFSWYIIEKTDADDTTKTSIKSQFRKQNYSLESPMKDIPFMAKLLSKESVSLLKKFYKADCEKFSFSTDSALHASNKKHLLSKVKGKKHPYLIKHTSTQDLYSSEEHPKQKKKKVLVCDSGYLNPFYDKAQCGVTQHHFYSMVGSDKEGQAKEALLKSSLFTFVFEICKWSGYHNINVLKNLPYPELKKYDDESIYKALGLTNKEIKLVEEVIGKNE